MDNEKIEHEAVRNAAAYINQCDCLKARFDVNDKTPSWDGYIEVYKDKKLKKDNMQGRIPVQIKGKGLESKSPPKSNIYYPFDISDMINYKSDGGVILFVVYLNRNYEKLAIYYASLVPIDFNHLLKDIASKKKIRLNLIQVPDTQTFIEICINFLNDKIKQFSFMFTPKTELHFEEYRFHITSSDPFSYMLNNQFSFYGVIRDIEYPISKIQAQELSSSIKQDILINGKKYYDHYILEKTADMESVRLGKSVKITPSKRTINFSLQGTLDERIIDGRFMLEIYQGHNIYTSNGIDLGKLTSYDKKDIDRVKKFLQLLENLKSIFQYYNVTHEIDFSKIDKESERIINLLIDLIHNNDVFETEMELNILSLFNIGNISIAAIARKFGKNKYKITNLFKKGVSESATLKNDNEVVPASVFVGIPPEQLIKFSNLDWNVVVNDIISVQYSELYSASINKILLLLLNEYDKVCDQVILDVTQKIAEYLIDNSENPRYYLNYLQILKRNPDFTRFTGEQYIRISNIQNDSTNDKDIMFGISVLLENEVDAELYFEQMGSETRSEYLGYPIYKLWKRLSCN